MRITRSSAKVLIIDTNAAKALFEDESPIGKTIEIGKQPYTVIGVAAQVNTYEPTITNLTQYDSYASSKISYLFMPKTCWPISYSYDEPENVIVKAMSTDDMEKRRTERGENPECDDLFLADQCKIQGGQPA